MKLKVNREEMAEALAAVCSVAAVRTPKEILKCVRIDVEADAMLLSATDLELGLRYAVTQVEVEKPGEVLLVAEMLARIVRECSDEVLSLELSEGQLHVRGVGSHFQLVTHDAREFPPVAVMEGEPDVGIEHGLLRRLVEWTAYAAARESTRYAINGVLWEVEGDRLTMAATDGRRLGYGRGKLAKRASQKTLSGIVPTKALAVFSRLHAEPDTNVGVRMTDSQLVLDMGRSTLSSTLVEGVFPKYQDVIPSDNNQEARLRTLDFQSALKRAALLTNEESKGVRFAFSEGNLTLSSRAPEQGEAEIALPITYRGEPIEIGFNPLFILEMLRVTHADEITFALREPNRPGLLRVDEDFLYVVMPVSLTSA